MLIHPKIKNDVYLNHNIQNPEIYVFLSAVIQILVYFDSEKTIA